MCMQVRHNSQEIHEFFSDLEKWYVTYFHLLTSVLTAKVQSGGMISIISHKHPSKKKKRRKQTVFSRLLSGWFDAE
jgi:hypothetical protein